MEKPKRRIEEDWQRLHESAICAILAGRCANSYYGEMSMNTLISEAIWGADDLVEKLKKREAEEATTEQ